MNKGTKIVMLVLLLAVLLVGGGLLYAALGGVSGANPDGTRRVPSSLKDPTPAPTPTPAAVEAPAEEAVPVEEPASEPAEEPMLSEELAADFTVRDEEGNMVSLSDYFGRPIVVNFWATWCPPCRAELPDFDAAWAVYGDRVQFLMVDLTDGASDTVESATAFARDENGYSFPLFFDVDYSGSEAWAISAIPTTLFIRADGSLLYKQVGMLDAETLESWISQLLE